MKLKYIRQGNHEQANFYENAYKMVQETLHQYEFEFNEEQFRDQRAMDQRVALANRSVALEERAAKFPGLYDDSQVPTEEAALNYRLIDKAREIELTDDLILKPRVEYLQRVTRDEDYVILDPEQEEGSLMGGTPIVLDRGQEVQNLSDLPVDERLVAQTLIPKLGKEIVLMLFNPDQQVRLEALTDLSQGLRAIQFTDMERSELQEMFIALLAVANKGCADRDARVAEAAIDLFLDII